MKIFRLYKYIFFLYFIGISYASEFEPNIYEYKDHIGRVFKLNKPALRVVSLAPNITEIIFSLKVQNKLVGVSINSDYPEEAKLIPKIGSYVNPDLEKIVSLMPDLCIAIKDGSPIELINRLELFKIPVYVVDPKDLSSMLKTIIDIGSLLDVKLRATILVGLLKDRVDRIKIIVSKAKNMPRVFFQIGISPIVGVGKNTFINDLIELSNGLNIIEGVLYPKLNRETVIKLLPDIIILTSMKNEAVLLKEKSNWKNWPNIPAVINQKIFLGDASLFERPSPRLIDGLELLASMIHPELFKGFQ